MFAFLSAVERKMWEKYDERVLVSKENETENPKYNSMFGALSRLRKSKKKIIIIEVSVEALSVLFRTR